MAVAYKKPEFAWLDGPVTERVQEEYARLKYFVYADKKKGLLRKRESGNHQTTEDAAVFILQKMKMRQIHDQMLLRRFHD